MDNIANSKSIILTVFCIDKRFDYLTTEYFDGIGFRYNYYLLTTAGSALCLGYEKYCSEICNSRCNCSFVKNCLSDNNCLLENNYKNACDPTNKDMELLKESIIKNIDIALSLDNLEQIYLLNHQDCGAIKAYLECSGYPKKLGDNNPLEIKINTDLLLFASQYIKQKFNSSNIVLPNIKLGLIDINGTVSDYDYQYNSWNLIFRGPGTNPLGLWYGL